MKKTLIMSSAVILMVISLTVGLSFAGNGRGNKTGVCDKTGCPVYDICTEDVFNYAGVVANIVPGYGMMIAAEDEDNITIYGMGPIRYWSSLNIERPGIGDIIRVDGYTVNYNGIIRNIATSVAMWNGETWDDKVELRNSVTCAPLWRKQYSRGR